MVSENVNGGTRPNYRMMLFVADNESNSRDARSNIQKICDRHLDGAYEMEVVDVLQDYRKALENRVLITPTLLVLTPTPVVRIVGTLEDDRAVLAAMRLADGR